MLLGAEEEIAQPIIWWTALPITRKSEPLDPAPSTPAKSTRLFAARNEFESLPDRGAGGRKDLQDVDIDISELTDKRQRRDCPGKYLHLSRTVRQTRIHRLRAMAEDYGRILSFRASDHYVHERRNAFPFAVSRGHNQAVWVEVFVPGTARPGTYEGSARVSIAGTVQFSVPINLTVWGFTLPPTSTLKSSFGLSGVAALKQHRGRYTDDEDLYAIARMYAKAALLHLASPYTEGVWFLRNIRATPADCGSIGARTMRKSVHFWTARLCFLVSLSTVRGVLPRNSAHPRAWPVTTSEGCIGTSGPDTSSKRAGSTDYFSIFGMNRQKRILRRWSSGAE